MNKVARQLTKGMGLELALSWVKRKSSILGEFSIGAGNTHPTGVTQARKGLRSRRFRNFISAVAVAAVLGGSLVYLRTALAQVPALTFELLAAGFNPERFRINEKGPSDVLPAKIVGQPGGDTGWHTHPGPVIVVVKTGALTLFRSNGCASVYPAGSVLVEPEAEVHKVVNEGSVACETYATFILPHGSQPLQPAADPGSAVCQPGQGDDQL